MKTYNFGKTISFISAFAFMLVMSVSQAMTLSFEKLSANAPEDIHAQLSVDVNAIYTGADITGASFSINNDVVYDANGVITSGIQSSISEIYFDYISVDNFLSIVIDTQVGTEYCDTNTCVNGGGNPVDVHPGELPSSTFSSEYAADSVGNPAKGVDRSTDELIFIATLGNWSYDQMIAALGNGDFRIGFHIQEIGRTLDSDSYASVSAVPVPAAAWLFGTALFGFFASARCKKRS